MIKIYTKEISDQGRSPLLSHQLLIIHVLHWTWGNSLKNSSNPFLNKGMGRPKPGQLQGYGARSTRSTLPS